MSKFFDSSSSSIILPDVENIQLNDDENDTSKLHKFPNCWNIWHHHTYKSIVKEGEDQEEEPTVPTVPTVPTPQEEPQEEVDDNTTATATTATTTTTTAGTDKSQPHDLDRYLQTTKIMSFPNILNNNQLTNEINSIEQMWQCLIILKKPTELPKGTDFLIFKKGIKPIWEDPINQKGGRWSFKFGKTTDSSTTTTTTSASLSDLKKSRRVNLIWERLVMKCLSNTLIPNSNLFKNYLDDDISGIILSVRKSGDSISIWNQNLCLEKFEKFEKNKISKILNDLSDDENDEVEGNENEVENANEVENEVEDELEYTNDIEDSIEKSKKQVKLTPFLVKRGICDAMFCIIREVDSILKAEEERYLNKSDNVYNTIISNDLNSKDKKIQGVMMHYRLHQEPTNTTPSNNTNNNNNNNSNNTKFSNGNGHNKKKPFKKDHSNTNSRRFNKKYSSNKDEYDSTNQIQEHQEQQNQNTQDSTIQESRFKWSNNNNNKSNNNNNNNSINEVENSSSGNSNMFASLGKQRKKLDLNEDGTGEFKNNGDLEISSLLNFGSRRRLQQSNRRSTEKLN